MAPFDKSEILYTLTHQNIYGIDSDTLDEIARHTEAFSLDEIPRFIFVMNVVYGASYPNFAEKIGKVAEIIVDIARQNGAEGMRYLIANFRDFHQCTDFKTDRLVSARIVQGMLTDEAFPLVKEAVQIMRYSESNQFRDVFYTDYSEPVRIDFTDEQKARLRELHDLIDDIYDKQYYQKWVDYKAGTYRTMPLQWKMDFFNGMHLHEIPLFNLDGFDMDTFEDYHEIQKEFLSHPEWFTREDMLTFLSTLDEDFFEWSMMEGVVVIISNIALQDGTEGLAFLLAHLKDVHRCGDFFGHFRITQRMLRDEYLPILKEAVETLGAEDRQLLYEIYANHHYEGDEEKVEEIKNFLLGLGAKRQDE